MHKMQIYIDRELELSLAEEAALRSVSKAALIRSLLRMGLETGDQELRAASAAAGMDGLIGALDIEPFDVDEAVYG
jgi:hypothetical protein